VVDYAEPSEVRSIRDPDAIADFDAALKETAPSSDVIHLGEGFTAHRDTQAGTGREVWRCFNAEGQFCANKSSPAAARHWFENNTTVGREIAVQRGAK
jgi:hypothetical protein